MKLYEQNVNLNCLCFPGADGSFKMLCNEAISSFTPWDEWSGALIFYTLWHPLQEPRSTAREQQAFSSNDKLNVVLSQSQQKPKLTETPWCKYKGSAKNCWFWKRKPRIKSFLSNFLTSQADLCPLLLCAYRRRWCIKCDCNVITLLSNQENGHDSPVSNLPSLLLPNPCTNQRVVLTGTAEKLGLNLKQPVKFLWWLKLQYYVWYIFPVMYLRYTVKFSKINAVEHLFEWNAFMKLVHIWQRNHTISDFVQKNFIKQISCLQLRPVGEKKIHTLEYLEDLNM